MVRGCQKKIIYLKNTESGVFDEAYFVVSDSALSSDIDECDMVEEANRILDECVFTEEENSLKNIIFDIAKKKTIPFILGIAIGIVIGLIIN